MSNIDIIAPAQKGSVKPPIPYSELERISPKIMPTLIRDTKFPIIS
jgi:hypothetical protein